MYLWIPYVIDDTASQVLFQTTHINYENKLSSFSRFRIQGFRIKLMKTTHQFDVTTHQFDFVTHQIDFSFTSSWFHFFYFTIFTFITCIFLFYFILMYWISFYIIIIHLYLLISSLSSCRRYQCHHVRSCSSSGLPLPRILGNPQW